MTVKRDHDTNAIVNGKGSADERIMVAQANTDITERKQLEEHLNQLRTVFESMADGVFVFDCEGNVVQANTAVRELFSLNAYPEYFSPSPAERGALMVARDEHGQSLPEERQPITRVLRGEILKGVTAVDIMLQALDGRELQLNVSGAPLRDQEGNITGCVMVLRDVTERRLLECRAQEMAREAERYLERRTHDALAGLLAMAESLVQFHDHVDDTNEVGRRLAELTRDVLGCQRVGILAVESGDLLRPVAVVGLSPEQERVWWTEQQQQENSLSNNPLPELVSRLRAKEVLVLDMTQPPFRDQPNPYSIKAMLVAPMCVGDELVGLLTLDYSGAEHLYKQDEIALATAVANLAALVIERQRLLHERAEAQGREVALREANRRMEEFLGIASHELRTPLTTIKANVQLAQRRLKSIVQSEVVPLEAAGKIEVASDMLARAERQIGVLNRLVGDLIDISRIQTGKLQLHLRQEPCDLAMLVYETIQEQRKAAPERVIHLQMPSAESVPVIADPDRIAQVLTNYLSNALKYSAVSKPVEVQLEVVEGGRGAYVEERGAGSRYSDAGGEESEGPVARVAVRDAGSGLPLKEQERVWECFYQSDGVKVLSGSGVGLGLGLHISQTLIERHHGYVGVQSMPGEGSTFWFTLPLAQITNVAGG